MTPDRAKYAPGILDALERRGWSRNKLAVKMGIRPASVYEWADGRVKPSVESLFAVGRALGLATVITADGVRFVEHAEVVLPEEGD